MIIEDKLLIFRFKQGRSEALRLIYDKYKIELLKLAIVLIGDVNTAEDIVHDVFVKFAQSADRFKLTGSLKSYLVTSIINRVRNYLRDSNRHCEITLEGVDSLLSTESSPHQWAILSEQLSILSQALQQLPYEQREVICFRMEMDMTFRRIAKLQCASINTVKGRYRYAIARLRSLLNSEVEK
jgi:RNA polymerase sigma-70 factor (ECF subfamily)